MPSAPFYTFFADDHDRLRDLFRRATTNPNSIDIDIYMQFRSGLLKHITMEEKVLLPAAQRASGGKPLPDAEHIKLDHGAIAALLVPFPTPLVVNALRSILQRHNELEESEAGIYRSCEKLAGEDVDGLLETLRSMPDVPMNPLRDPMRVVSATRRALKRAGYDLDAFAPFTTDHS